jgi:hypothetical protein
MIHDLMKFFRLDLIQMKMIQDHQLIPLPSGGQGHFHGQLFNLFIDFRFIGPWPWSENHPSFSHQRGGPGSLPGSAGPFLTKRLFAAASDFGSIFGRGGSSPLPGLKAQYHLMKYMGINLPVKNLILQKKFFHLFSGEVIDSYRWHAFFLDFEIRFPNPDT